MKSRVTVTIGNQDYTLLTAEDENLILRVAELVNAEMASVSEGSRITDTQCAVLSAMNIGERLLVAEQTVENLRSQVKDYLDDAQKAKADAAEARRELSRMKNQK